MKHKYSKNAQGEWVHQEGLPTKADVKFMNASAVGLFLIVIGCLWLGW